MVRLEGKKSIMLFCVFLFLPSILLFLLSGSRNIAEWISTGFYVIVSIASLAILGAWIRSDDKYYRNFHAPYLLAAIITGLGMIMLSWGLSAEMSNPAMLLSVNKAFPIPGLEASTLSIVAMPTSVSTMFLSTVLYGLVMAATSEELFKLALFAEGKERWGRGYKIGDITIPGVLVYVGFPVGFWAALHGIQAYSDPVMIFPAFVNGVVLIIYLWKTRCILGCIFAHWVYNAGITFLTYLNGTANIAAGTPFLPNPFDRNYYANSGFIYDFLVILLLVMFLLFFLLPSLTREKGTNSL